MSLNKLKRNFHFFSIAARMNDMSGIFSNNDWNRKCSILKHVFCKSSLTPGEFANVFDPFGVKLFNPLPHVIDSHNLITGKIL